MRRSYFAPNLSAPILMSQLYWPLTRAKMVEAPGTAPGSALLISQHVYRHSWISSFFIIVVLWLVLKNSFDSGANSDRRAQLQSAFLPRVIGVWIDYDLAQGRFTMSF